MRIPARLEAGESTGIQAVTFHRFLLRVFADRNQKVGLSHGPPAHGRERSPCFNSVQHHSISELGLNTFKKPGERCVIYVSHQRRSNSRPVARLESVALTEAVPVERVQLQAGEFQGGLVNIGRAICTKKNVASSPISFKARHTRRLYVGIPP